VTTGNYWFVSTAINKSLKIIIVRLKWVNLKKDEMLIEILLRVVDGMLTPTKQTTELKS